MTEPGGGMGRWSTSVGCGPSELVQGTAQPRLEQAGVRFVQRNGRAAGPRGALCQAAGPDDDRGRGTDAVAIPEGSIAQTCLRPGSLAQP